MVFDPSKYAVAEAKPMPVILLLDVSGSMCGEKISALNQSVKKMIDECVSFANKGEASVEIGIITFGSNVNYFQPVATASDAQKNWHDMTAGGMTPMGTALRMAKDLIEDKSIIKSRSYRPLVVLVSDGEPNDNWQDPLRNFIEDGRTQKCTRMALAIGNNANTSVLRQFSGSDELLYQTDNIGDISSFFNTVTMTVTKTVQTANIKSQPIDNNLSSKPNVSSSNVEVTSNEFNTSFKSDDENKQQETSNNDLMEKFFGKKSSISNSNVNDSDSCDF